MHNSGRYSARIIKAWVISEHGVKIFFLTINTNINYLYVHKSVGKQEWQYNWESNIETNFVRKKALHFQEGYRKRGSGEDGGLHPDYKLSKFLKDASD